MDTFIISDNPAITNILIEIIPPAYKTHHFIFQQDFYLEENYPKNPKIIIIVSTKNETWGWWITGELIFKFPEANFLIIQHNNDLKCSGKLSDKIFLFADSIENLTTQVPCILKDFFPKRLPRI